MVNYEIQITIKQLSDGWAWFMYCVM